MTFNWRLWLKGLYAAAIGGATTAAVNVLSDPSAMGRPKEIGTIAGAGAAVGALSYLKTHPLVPPDHPEATDQP